MVFGFTQGQAGDLCQPGNHTLGKFRMGVKAGTDGCAAERQLAETVHSAFQFADDQCHLAEIAAKNLAETDWCGVLQVGAGDGHDVVEFAGLCAQSFAELVKLWQQLFLDLHSRGQMHDGGDHVVA